MTFHEQVQDGMADILNEAGVTVSLARGATPATTLRAVPGSTSVQQTSQDGVQVVRRDRDWLIATTDYKIAAVVVLPATGDKITDAGTVWEVLPNPTGRCFDYSDTRQARLRVHTKQIT